MTDNQRKTVLTSIFAGLMIGVGCMVYLSCESRALGAFLFSAGLFFVLTFGGTLFTGVCGLKTPWRRLLAVFALNGAGILLAGALTWGGGELAAPAAAMVRKKLLLSPLAWLCNGFLCGVMMYLGVTGFKRAAGGTVGLASVLYAVPVFILAAFEHSIADMGYLAMALPRLTAGELPAALALIATVAAGNVLGSKAARILTEHP